MYNDNTFDGLFTGTSDGNGGWNYPTAPQNIVIKFANFYLDSGDLVSGGATIASETGEAEDFTIGNAPAKVFNATFNDPDDLMDSLTWGDGAVYIGCVTASTTADTYSSRPCHIYVGTVHYSINASGNAYRNSTNLGSLGGSPVAVISNSDGSDVYFVTTNNVGRRVNNTFSTITPSPEQALLVAKYGSTDAPLGVMLNANGLPSVFNDVTNNTKQTFGYVPMGTFDFSNIDTAGIAFAVEAYDKMTLFDADATDWVASLSFGTPQTIDDLVSALMTEMGMTATISASAVNRLVSWSVNPITSYAVTYRDVLKWLAEIMGCNARIGRTGNVEFYTIDPTAVETIEPGVIVGSTRTKTRYSIPVIDKVVCYNTLGAGYEVHTGSGDVPYYIVGNPFLDPSADTQPLTDLLGVLDDVPAYYPTTLNQVCADPRLDSGDVVNARPINGATDGTDDYPVLVTRQSLTWNNACLAGITSTGNQVRAIPESMNNTDLSSMVDSNPSAVVNKIEAHGITADCITSGTIDADLIRAGTIQDANGYNSWDLDSGDLTITTGSITTTYTKTYAYADYSASDITRIQQIRAGQITPTDADYEKYDIIGIGVINAASQNRVQQIIDTQTDLVKTVSTVIDPSQSVTTMTISVDVPAVGTAQAFNYSSEYSGVMVSAYTLNASRFNGGSFEAGTPDHAMGLDFEELYMSDSPDYLSLRANGISFDDGADTTTMNKAGVSVTDGTNTLGIASTGITFQDGTASSKLSVIKRTMDSANTTNVTLQRGVYLAIVSHTNNTTAGQQGLYVIQAYDTNSVVLTVTAAANSTLTISGLTLTWTTTNTYRALRLIYLS